MVYFCDHQMNKDEKPGNRKSAISTIKDADR